MIYIYWFSQNDAFNRCLIIQEGNFTQRNPSLLYEVIHTYVSHFLGRTVIKQNHKNSYKLFLLLHCYKKKKTMAFVEMYDIIYSTAHVDTQGCSTDNDLDTTCMVSPVLWSIR